MEIFYDEFRTSRITVEGNPIGVQLFFEKVDGNSKYQVGKIIPDYSLGFFKEALKGQNLTIEGIKVIHGPQRIVFVVDGIKFHLCKRDYRSFYDCL